MHIKRFKGRELPEVMRQVRDDLGPEAVILHTRADAPRGLRRFMGGQSIEIVAAVDDGPATTAPAASMPGRPGAPAASPAPRPTVPVRRDDVAAEIAELRHLFIRTSGARTLPAAMATYYAWLLGRGLDESLALRLLDGQPPVAAAALVENIEARLAGLIPVAAASLPPRAVTIAMVGPSGTGKTTALAKLAVAAHLAGLTPGLLTLDGSAVGGTVQLETLGRIIDVPCAVALTRADLVTAVEGPLHGPRLVDTPPVSPRDAAGVAHLAELLGTVRPAEVHLVLAATMSRDDMLAAVRGFAPLGVTHLFFTRLDEAEAPGALVSAAAAGGRPLSYISTGRNVPEDVQPAVARDVAKRILQGDPA